MYKSGTDLSDDFTAEGDPDPDTISVVDPNLFSVNDVIIVFDADHPSGETATITAINGDCLTLDIDLENSYDAGYPLVNGKGAAVVEQGTCVYDADAVSRVWDAFTGAADGSDGGCFVGVQIPCDGSTNTPYKDTLGEFTPVSVVEYSDVWSSHTGESNYIHLIGARCERFPDDESYGVAFIWEPDPGSQDHNVVCVYVEAITVKFGGSAAVANADTTAHEIGHMAAQSQVDGDHVDVWCHEGSGTDLCLMDHGREREDGYSEFCHCCPDHIDVWRDAIDDLPLGKP